MARPLLAVAHTPGTAGSSGPCSLSSAIRAQRLGKGRCQLCSCCKRRTAAWGEDGGAGDRGEKLRVVAQFGNEMQSGTKVWSRWGCACVKVDFQGEEKPDSSRER